MIIPERGKWKVAKVPKEFDMIVELVAKKKRKKKKEIFQDLENYLLIQLTSKE